MTLSRGWPAPAKVNRFLHITGRRADGYHELQTLFQFLDHGDELDVEVTDDGWIVRESGLAGLAPEQDFTVRAARALQAAAGVGYGARLRLHKRLPAGGGLGGGSSDAATTLVALNHLWGAGLDEDALAAIGLTLGADVPVFVRGRAAWAEGVGERLCAVEPDCPWFVVVDPGVAVATGAVFGAVKLTRNTPRIRIPRLDTGSFRNDCEPVVRELYPAVAQALDWLGRYSSARLTGTGGCVFATFAEQAAACAVYARLPEAWHGFVARGLNASPLRERLEAARQPPQAVRPTSKWGVAKR